MVYAVNDTIAIVKEYLSDTPEEKKEVEAEREELIEKLNLEDIKVENIRGEDYALEHREEYDYVPRGCSMVFSSCMGILVLVW